MDEVIREVELDSAPERAWQAISEESELAEWLGGDVEVDLVPGGEITVTGQDGERSGFIESVEEGRGISFWWSEDEGETSRVAIDVITGPEPDRCLVRVVESRPLAGLEQELADITAVALAA